jgi:hypothetical protein
MKKYSYPNDIVDTVLAKKILTDDNLPPLEQLRIYDNQLSGAV